MSILDIKVFPNPLLREKCQNIKALTNDIQQLIDDMTETMVTSVGLGLAAPQVGESVNIIVFNDLGKVGGEIKAVINPEIISAEGEINEEEGCLSIPEIFAKVKRAEKIVLKGIDRNEKEIAMNVNGRLSQVIQHELDHLQGILFWDKIGTAKRDLLKKKFNKIRSSSSS
jgi:peptide deformylase